MDLKNDKKFIIDLPEKKPVLFLRFIKFVFVKDYEIKLIAVAGGFALWFLLKMISLF
ncbi:MAG: hypothetical protein LBS99_01385 [Clostridiales bacterium]|jgi:hypothetical protein|nr:hypothetical protein [Clostridiales bacterium]